MKKITTLTKVALFALALSAGVYSAQAGTTNPGNPYYPNNGDSSSSAAPAAPAPPIAMCIAFAGVLALQAFRRSRAA
jgi:ABC-type oligopeptide transport system substrate-binding subunit